MKNLQTLQRNGGPFWNEQVCPYTSAACVLIRYQRSSFEFVGGFTTAVDLVEDVSLYGDSHFVPCSPTDAYDIVQWASLFLSFVLLHVICTKYFCSKAVTSVKFKRKIK